MHIESDLRLWSFRGKLYKWTWLQLRCCALTHWDLMSVNFKVQRCMEVHGKLEMEGMVSRMGLEVQSKSRRCGVWSEGLGSKVGVTEQGSRVQE